MNTTAHIDDLKRIINADHNNPFSVLGLHEISGESESKKFVVKSFLPNAAKITLIDDNNQSYHMDKIDQNGVFEVFISDKSDYFDYTLQVEDDAGNKFRIVDPYSFLPDMPEYDLHLFNEGNHHKIYNRLGAHLKEIKGIKGTLFTVWAPCAKRVSVVGTFNHWDGRRHQMRALGSSGVWEIFIPKLGQGELYKYEIKTPFDDIYIKADPYAFFAEKKPKTASIIFPLDNYEWNDNNWMKERDSSNSLEKPMSIYEVHLGSWIRLPDDTEEDGKRGLTYKEHTEKLISYVLDMGYTHIELLPLAEHPFDGSWGYQITGYYAVTSRYGTPDDFKHFIDRCHQNSIGVIMDWVPAHFPKDGHGLARFDGTALYEHEDKRLGEHPDWGTHIFNYGRNEVKNFLISNALFWMDIYHIDGLRVDAVASMLYLDYAKKDGEWLPNKWGGKENIEAIDFMRQLNTTIYKYFSGALMIAEESTSWALVSKPSSVGGLGFSYKWNMGWMNDFLKFISLDPLYRKYHLGELTFSMVYAFAENFTLVLSHDEVVHGKCSMISKMPGDYWQKFAGLRLSYTYMYGHPGKKLLFMGGEFGQFIEWNYKEGLDWHLLDYPLHNKLQKCVKDLNNLYKSQPAMYEVDFDQDGFEWIDCSDTKNCIISFVRKGNDWRDMLLFISNFTPNVHYDYRIGAPKNVFYEEIFNSDAEIYGGSNVGNPNGVHADEIKLHDKPYSIKLTIPPLATLVLKAHINKD
ncbi:MAG: 1,4-alpha-glucan branching protein GlgB [Clostridiales bacterium]